MPMSAVALVLTTLVAFYLPRPRAPQASREAVGRFPVVSLLANRPFVLMMIAAAFIQSSHAVYYGFSTLHWRAHGHGDDVIGWLWAEGVIVEVALFTFSAAVVRRLGPTTLLIIGDVVRLHETLGWYRPESDHQILATETGLRPEPVRED